MVEIIKLKNGITLIVEEFPTVESVSMRILVKTGARNEKLFNTGISHFIEHMIFKGTKNRTSKQIAYDFENIGAKFNAYTSKETTVFYSKVLKEYTEQSLEILIDMLENSLFEDQELEKEKNVILQELAMNNDNPSDFLYDNFMETVFPRQQIGRSILGPSKNIKNFKRDDFIKYLFDNYNSENIILSVCGNVKTSFIEDIANKLFKKIKNSKCSVMESGNYIGGYYKKIKKHLEQFQCILGFNGISYNDNDMYKVIVGNHIFGDSVSSRLFQEIREKQGLCYSIDSYNTSFKDCGVFNIYVGTDGEKINQAIDSIIKEFKNFFTKAITEEELKRAKIQIKSSLIMTEESCGGRASSNANDYSKYNRIITNNELIEKIENVTNYDIKNIFEKIFFDKNITVALYGNNDNVYDYETIKNKICK